MAGHDRSRAERRHHGLQHLDGPGDRPHEQEREPPKLIDEFVGRASTGDGALSIARMRSPSGWAEPGQRPEFDEFTIVLRGAVVVEFEGGRMTVEAGQAVHASPGEWVRYSTPGEDGAEYVSVCLPAFAPGTVHRDG